MACLGVSTDVDWVVAGWAFRQFLDDVNATGVLPRDVSLKLDDAKATGYLFLDDEEKLVAEALRIAFLNTINGILKGTLKSGIDDNLPELAEAYRQGLRDLQGIMPT